MSQSRANRPSTDATRASGNWRAAGVSERVAYKWLARYRAGGAAALDDRKSTPARCPHRTPAETVLRIEALRRERLSG